VLLLDIFSLSVWVAIHRLAKRFDSGMVWCMVRWPVHWRLHRVDFAGQGRIREKV
jgi:hypothetical protein